MLFSLLCLSFTFEYIRLLDHPKMGWLNSLIYFLFLLYLF
nr:MAG TPA: hypothetical protein [Caudoviricetes sp.]